VTTGRPEVESLLTQQTAHWASVAGNALDATQAGLANLHALVFREALVMTFSDTFYVLAMCFAVGIVSVIFVRPIGAAPPSPDAH
jgi:MFS transporter, DHA2 family, multidrug resistance protein